MLRPPHHLRYGVACEATWPLSGFDGYELLVSVGHDEYYSAAEIEKLRAYTAAGASSTTAPRLY